MRNVIILSVGPSDPDYMNEITRRELLSGIPVILRTDKHPLASWLKANHVSFSALDSLYESSDNFDALIAEAANCVWKSAEKSGCVIYAVPDAISDSSVDEIIRNQPEDGHVTVVPGFSYSDYYLSLCRPVLRTSDIRISSASDFLKSDLDPSLPVLITEINDPITAGEVKRCFSEWIDDEESVWFIRANKLPVRIPLYELDRQDAYDHLTAVVFQGAHYRNRKRKTFNDLIHIMDLLRSREGCPWDRVQTHKSLLPYLIEEAWEVADAIQEGDPEHLAEELGDLLFQIAFHTSIGATFDEFTVSDVMTGICDKMIRRHPNVFSENENAGSHFQSDEWEKIKLQESGCHSVGDSLLLVSRGLTAIQYAEKVIKKLRAYPSLNRKPETIILDICDICGKIREMEIAGRSEMLGGLLFFCSELMASCGMDGEILLHEAARRIVDAFRSYESNGNNRFEPPEGLTFNDLGVY